MALYATVAAVPAPVVGADVVLGASAAWAAKRAASRAVKSEGTLGAAGAQGTAADPASEGTMGAAGAEGTAADPPSR